MGDRQRSERVKLWILASAFSALVLMWVAVRRYYTPGFQVFDGFGNCLVLGLFALVHLAILWSALVGKGQRDLRGLAVMGVLAVLALLVMWTMRRLEREREQVPVVLAAYYDGDINGVGIELRTDGTYKAVDATVIGGAFFFGDYSLKGDTVQLGPADLRWDDEEWRYGQRMVVDGDSIRLLSGPSGWSPEMRVTEDRRR